MTSRADDGGYHAFGFPEGFDKVPPRRWTNEIRAHGTRFTVLTLIEYWSKSKA